MIAIAKHRGGSGHSILRHVPRDRGEIEWTAHSGGRVRRRRDDWTLAERNTSAEQERHGEQRQRSACGHATGVKPRTHAGHFGERTQGQLGTKPETKRHASAS